MTKSILKKIGLGILIFCLVLVLGFLTLLYMNGYSEYQIKRSFIDINAARNLLHESARYASLYADKDLAISDYIKGTLIRSDKGLEAINLFEGNLNSNLKKSVDLVEQAAKNDPHVWDKFTELINKRVEEKTQLYALDREYLDNMRAYYNDQMTDEAWNKYANETYPAKMASWNTLNKANTDFNIQNKLEEDPDASVFNQKAVIARYKPSIKEVLAGVPESNEEPTQVYYGIEDQQYPVISEIYDDYGDTVKVSSSNGYDGPDTYINTTSATKLKAGDFIFIAAVGTNLKEEKKLYYLFTSNSPDFNAFYGQSRGSGVYTDKPYFLYKVTPKDLQSTNGKMKIEVRLKAEGNSHRIQSGNYDDSAFIVYNLTN